MYIKRDCGHVLMSLSDAQNGKMEKTGKLYEDEGKEHNRHVRHKAMNGRQCAISKAVLHVSLEVVDSYKRVVVVVLR
jgi:hypothetical protein